MEGTPRLGPLDVALIPALSPWEREPLVGDLSSFLDSEGKRASTQCLRAAATLIGQQR